MISNRAACVPLSARTLVPRASSATTISATLIALLVSVASERLVVTLVSVTVGGLVRVGDGDGQRRGVVGRTADLRIVDFDRSRPTAGPSRNRAWCPPSGRGPCRLISNRAACVPLIARTLVPRASSVTTISATLIGTAGVRGLGEAGGDVGQTLRLAASFASVMAMDSGARESSGVVPTWP